MTPLLKLINDIENADTSEDQLKDTLKYLCEKYNIYGLTWNHDAPHWNDDGTTEFEVSYPYSFNEDFNLIELSFVSEHNVEYWNDYVDDEISVVDDNGKELFGKITENKLYCIDTNQEIMLVFRSVITKAIFYRILDNGNMVFTAHNNELKSFPLDVCY